jgi:hypothetical protein
VACVTVSDLSWRVLRTPVGHLPSGSPLHRLIKSRAGAWRGRLASSVTVTAHRRRVGIWSRAALNPTRCEIGVCRDISATPSSSVSFRFGARELADQLNVRCLTAIVQSTQQLSFDLSQLWALYQTVGLQICLSYGYCTTTIKGHAYDTASCKFGLYSQRRFRSYLPHHSYKQARPKLWPSEGFIS